VGTLVGLVVGSIDGVSVGVAVGSVEQGGKTRGAINRYGQAGAPYGER
jgi:hypothetical protein